MVKHAKRLGVGATALSTTAALQQDSFASADWTKNGKKKILFISKTRGAHPGEDEDVMDVTKREDANSSSEEEEGRTLAVKERKRKTQNVSGEGTSSGTKESTVGAVAPKTKKKRKGKKERGKESNVAVVVDKPDNKDNRVTEDESDVQKIESSNNNTNEQNKKYQRKKSRSRQKNIKKDTRSIDKKPAHLVLGNSDFAGRPLTKATKEKLGLTSLSEDKLPNKPFSSNTENSSSAKLIEGLKESIIIQSKVEKASDLTMIGDCVVGNVVVRSMEKTNPDDIKKKKPKRKFKNY